MSGKGSKKTTTSKSTAKQPASASSPARGKKAGAGGGSPFRRSTVKTNGALPGAYRRPTIDVIRLAQGVLAAFVGSTKPGYFSFDLPLTGGPLSGDPAADHLKVAVIGQLTHPGSEFVQTGQPSKSDGKEHAVRVLIRILSSPGENTAATAKAWGDQLATFYVKNSKFPTHPIVRVLNSSTSISDLPPVNHHIRNEDAAKIAQLIYPEPIENGSFWEHEPTVTSFFGDTENPQSLFHVLLDGDAEEDEIPEHNIIN